MTGARQLTQAEIDAARPSVGGVKNLMQARFQRQLAATIATLPTLVQADSPVQADGSVWIWTDTLPDNTAQADQSPSGDSGFWVRRPVGPVKVLNIDFYRRLGMLDDAVALSSEARALSDQGGGDIQLENRRYNIASQWIIWSRVTFKGVGTKPLVGINEIQAYAAELLGYQCPTFYVTHGSTPDPLSGAVDTLANTAVLMRLNSGLTGCVLYDPTQVTETSGAPTQRGFMIGSDFQIGGSMDNIHLSRLGVLNPYRGISMVLAAKFLIEDIYGQPILTGLYCNRVYDVSRVVNVSWWTYHARPGTALYEFIYHNATGFRVARVDDVKFWGCFAFGYNRFLHAVNDGAGTPWASFTNCIADVCRQPIWIDAMYNIQILGGSWTCTQPSGAVVQTGTGGTDGGVFYMGAGAFVTGGAAVGAVVSAGDGTFTFDHVTWGLTDTNTTTGAGDNGIHSTILISEGRGARVQLDGLRADDVRRVYGGAEVRLGGQPLPALDRDVSSTYAGHTISDMTTWSVLQNPAAVQAADHVEVPMNGQETLVSVEVPPDLIREGLPLALVFDWDTTSVTSDSFNAFLRTRREFDDMSLLGPSHPLYQDAVRRICWPITVGYVTGGRMLIHFEIGSYAASCTGSVFIRNARLYQQRLEHTTPGQLDMLRRWWRDWSAGQGDYGYNAQVAGGLRRLLGDQAPTTGTWQAGEYVRNVNAAETGDAGKKSVLSGWRCILPNAAGSAPRFVEDRVLTGN